MSNFKFTLNRDGVKELLQSEEMMAVLRGYGEAIWDRVGDGYEMETMVGKTRDNVRIVASTDSAIKDNAKNNTLLKALKGGG